MYLQHGSDYTLYISLPYNTRATKTFATLKQLNSSSTNEFQVIFSYDSGEILSTWINVNVLVSVRKSTQHISRSERQISLNESQNPSVTSTCLHRVKLIEF